MDGWIIIKSTVRFFPLSKTLYFSFGAPPPIFPSSLLHSLVMSLFSSFLTSHFFYCACETCLLFFFSSFPSETKNLLYALFRIFLLLFLLPSLLRLVTLENSPAITPELLRLFQNMSALLGKHALDFFTVSVCKLDSPPANFTRF